MLAAKFIFLQQPAASPANGTDWDAVAAFGTLLAVVVALSLPFLQRCLDARDARSKRAETTSAAGPELVGDVMQVDWQLVRQVRTVKEALEIDSFSGRSLFLKAKFDSGELHFQTLIGRTLFPGVVEHLTPEVRLALSELRAKTLATDAMWRLLINGPFGRHRHAVGAVEAMLPDLMTNLVSVHDSCNRVMEALREHVHEDLKELGESIANQKPGFDRLVERAGQEKRAYLHRLEAGTHQAAASE
jgi:hypothetical protein